MKQTFSTSPPTRKGRAKRRPILLPRQTSHKINHRRPVHQRILSYILFKYCVLQLAINGRPDRQWLKLYPVILVIAAHL